MIKIADLVFDIHETMFCANIRLLNDVWQISWTMTFEAEYQDLTDKTGFQAQWKPSIFMTGNYFKSPVCNALVNTKLVFDDKNSDGEPLFMLHLFGHSPIRDVEIQFGDWLDNEIEVDFKGIADINYDETYDKDVKIQITTLLTPDYVQISTTDETQAKRLLTQFFPSVSFEKRSFDKREGFIFDFSEILK